MPSDGSDAIAWAALEITNIHETNLNMKITVEQRNNTRVAAANSGSNLQYHIMFLLSTVKSDR